MRHAHASFLMTIAAVLVACGSGTRPYASLDSGGSGGDDALGSSGSTGGASTTDPNAAGAGGQSSVTPIGNIDCTIAPINPNATQQAKNLLCYVYSVYGNHVLSGQQETSWSSPELDITWIKGKTGRFPAVLGGDYLYPQGTSERARDWWDAGGIPMLRYHMGAPPLADSYDNSKSKADIAAVLTPGTAENTSFNAKLDFAATELTSLQAANVAVLWAPLHEAHPQKYAWFWWSKGTGAEYVELWKYMYNYLTHVKGVNNAIWIMPFSNSPSAEYYPGKEFVDLAGPDTYDLGKQPFRTLFENARTIVGSTIPIPLHETGKVPNPDLMFPSAAPWVLFNVWAGYQRDATQNTETEIQAAYGSPYTITRDEIPSLK